MNCPSCGKTVAEAAWICGFCDHILDASVLGDVYDDSDETRDARAPSGREERTSLIAWKPKPDPRDDEVPDAMILGDVGVAEDDFQMVHGAAKRTDGRTATFLFYASGATSRIVHPDAIPRITGGDQTIPRTPYEDFILASIDGVRSVRDIHRASGLAPQEVVVTLLTLLDKGAIRIEGVIPERPSRTRELDSESEPTQAIQRPASNPIPDVQAEGAQRAKRAERGGPASPDRDPLDSDDLPSITDFDEIMSDGPDSFDDVWAESDEYDEITNGARPTADPADPADRKQSVRNQRSDTKPPVRIVDPLSELPTTDDPPADDPPTIVPARGNTTAPVPLLLDPAFLVEVPPSEVSPRPSISDLHVPEPPARRSSSAKKQAKEKQRKVLEKAVKRGPVEERVHSKKQAPPPQPQIPQPQQQRAKAEPVDSVNMLKAQKLFDQALKDKSEGNLVSARMNMKLAMTFDATNELYVQSFDELSKNPDAQVRTTGPTGKSRAREFYDAATEAENSGDVDGAIVLLEQAIANSKQAPFLNRLGVLLAMKKREFQRAQQLVEQAIELAPGNGAYEKNLQKILSMAATSGMRKNNEEKDAKKGLLGGLLGRRK